MNGKPGFPYFISPTQLNVLMPDYDAEVPISFQITTPGGKSGLWNSRAVVHKYAPAFFRYDAENRRYVAGAHPDGTLLGKPSLHPALALRPAKPGGIIQLYGCGFGPSDPPRPASEVVRAPSPLASPVTIRIDGNQTAKVPWAGIVGSGLVQINVEVPALADGDHFIEAEINGVRTIGAWFTVAN